METALPAPDEDELAHSQRLFAALREEIADQGAIPFSRYMERCLYAPGLGYYSAGRSKFGAAGDFVTAPELGALFAQCVAQAVAPTLRYLGAQAAFLELGGGSGAFAEQVLSALSRLDAVPAHYWILEPSADLQQRQKTRLLEALPGELSARVCWIQRPPETDWQGVLFANEVIDALPATRFTKREGEVFEEHVTLTESGKLGYVDRPADTLVTGAVRHLERDLGSEFPDGYRSELLPQLPYWMQAVAESMKCGVMLFSDYGYVRREYYLSERDQGTLVCHYRHHAHADPLHLPGLQDLTAFVDFTALAEAGRHAGFTLVSYASQAQFLIAAGMDEAFAAATASGEDEGARYALAQEVKRLTLPGQMGERFQAMLFARELPPESLPHKLLAADRSERL